MKELAGKTAVVTGGGSGIGRAIVLALAAAGTNVVVADINKEAADAVADEVSAYGVGSLGVKADVSKLEEVEALADAAYAKFNSVEILCNNAGVTLRPFRAHWDCSYEDWQWIMNINFGGILHGHLVFVPRMLKTSGEKHIVNTSSMSTFITLPGTGPYTAAKSAVDGLSNSAREELKQFGIGVSMLNPGPIRTGLVATSDQVMTEEQRAKNEKVKVWSDASTSFFPQKTAELEAVKKIVDPDVPSNYGEYITPKHVGRFVIEGILKNKPYIMTHPLPLEQIQPRFDAIINAVPTYPEK